jgi:sortase A
MGGAWAWLRAVVGTMLVTAAAGAGVVVFGPQPVAVVSEAAPATTTTTLAPVEDDPALSQPTAPPEDPHADVPILPIGEISIPDIGLRTTVYEGIWATVIDAGPGHWPGTAEPGGWGNTVIAGHRVSHSAPFRRIAELQVGDDIIVTTGDGTFTYDVSGTSVVTPDTLSIADQHPGRTITLFACHPPGSARYRYVVTGVLVEPGA